MLGIVCSCLVCKRSWQLSFSQAGRPASTRSRGKGIRKSDVDKAAEGESCAFLEAKMRRNISPVSTSPAWFSSVPWLGCAPLDRARASRHRMSTCEPWRRYVIGCSKSVLLSGRSLYTVWTHPFVSVAEYGNTSNDANWKVYRVRPLDKLFL